VSLVGLLLLCVSALAIEAQTLPPIHGVAVDGREITLPDAAKGRVAVLIIGFTRGSSVPVARWASRFNTDFSPGERPLILRLPFLEEVPKMFRGLAKSGVEKSAGQDRGEVVPIFESEATYKKLVHYSMPDDAYILVLDRAGAIRGVFTGDVGRQYGDVRDRVSHLLLDRAVAP
jgi:hypothetical protein